MWQSLYSTLTHCKHWLTTHASHVLVQPFGTCPTGQATNSRNIILLNVFQSLRSSQLSAILNKYSDLHIFLPYTVSRKIILSDMRKGLDARTLQKLDCGNVMLATLHVSLICFLTLRIRSLAPRVPIF